MTKIFAYGSLMNQRDLLRTVPDASNLTPARTYGYRRVFDLESTYRFDPETALPICVLNLEPANIDSYINGICFDMTQESFEELLEREKAYQLIEIDAFHYFTGDHFRANCFVSSDYKKYPYVISSELQLDYLRICAEGCSTFGEAFLTEFKRTTSFHGISEDDYYTCIWNKLHI
jgi:cation transport regulator ChaC